MSRFAADVADHELPAYQKTVRLLLRHPFITAVHPDTKALPRVRRYSAALATDLAEAFGYRLELHGATARLVRPRDLADVSAPAVTTGGRAFDRQRYALLALCLAVLGRCGEQTSVSELADAVASDAARVSGLSLSPDVYADRRAFVDAVTWLEERGIVHVQDGSTTAWASDPEAGEALLNIARDALFALYRPTRSLQTIDSVRALLTGELRAHSGKEERRVLAQQARRAVAERPVVYFRDVPDEVTNHLRGNALAADLARLTGLPVERRAEGVLLVDGSNLSVERFPGTGSVAQTAVLLTVEIADRVLDPDGRRVKRYQAPELSERQDRIIAAVDLGRPTDTAFDIETEEHPAPATMSDREDAPADDPDRLPFLPDSFLRTSTRDILRRYGKSFGAQWHQDPDRLCTQAVGLLARFGGVLPVDGGVLALPLLGRYRNTIATAKSRDTAPALFEEAT